jgi:hypothetical protein
MKIPSKPVKIFYKVFRALLSEPLNERICLYAIGFGVAVFIFQMVRYYVQFGT